MSSLTVAEFTRLIGGSLLSGNPEGGLALRFGTDSRKLEAGMVFFALSGERFDGNAFAPQALQQGAGAVVVSRPIDPVSESDVIILVDDTLKAYQRLAEWWRTSHLHLRGVVGITGSSGKTSTKDFTRAVLSEQFRVTATAGNLNNHIGVPISILRATPDDEVAIWEMGMNHAGELAPLCQMIQPNIGLISSIGSAHIEFLGSRDAIAEEKCTLARSLPSDGVMIFPASCDYAEFIRQSTQARCIAVGINEGDVQATNVQSLPEGSSFTLEIEGFCHSQVKLAVHGRHMISNALLAAAAGWAMGMDPDAIVRGLEHAVLTGGRLNCSQRNGVLVIDDTYNANPESMHAALDTLASMQVTGKRWAVLGRMGELGAHSEGAHRDVGRYAATCHLDGLVAVGKDTEVMAEEAQGMPEVKWFSTHQEAADWLAGEVHAGDAILFKGSRLSGMEKVLQLLFER